MSTIKLDQETLKWVARQMVRIEEETKMDRARHSSALHSFRIKLCAMSCSDTEAERSRIVEADADEILRATKHPDFSGNELSGHTTDSEGNLVPLADEEDIEKWAERFLGTTMKGKKALTSRELFLPSPEQAE